MPLCAQDIDMERDRNESGRYDDRIDPATVLDVFEAREDQARPLTAGDVVDELDIARRTAHNKLNALVERGVLETRKVGARGRVWWTPQHDAESGRESAETPTRDPRDQQDTPADTTPHTPERDEDGPREILDALDTSDRRRDTVRACVDYLREAGTASKSDFQREVYPDHPAGFQSEGGWWNEIGLDLLKTVADDTPAIHPPGGEGAHTWEYTESDQ